MSTAKLIFSGNDINVHFQEGGAHDLLVVTFTPWFKEQPVQVPPPAAFEYFASRGIACIGFQSRQNHWWQTHEMTSALKQIKPLLQNYSRVCTYGTSMGGHGALTFSRELEATRVVAVSPQFSIDRTLVPNEKRWSDEAFAFPRLFDPAAGVSESAEKVIVVDLLARKDAIQARMFSAIGNTTLVSVGLSGHFPLHRFRDTDSLSILMDLLFFPKLDLPAIRALVKTSRRNSPAYRVRLADRRHGLVRPRKAARVINEVKAKFLIDDPKSLLVAARIFCQAENYRRAFNFAKRSVESGAGMPGLTLAISSLKAMGVPERQFLSSLINDLSEQDRDRVIELFNRYSQNRGDF